MRYSLIIIFFLNALASNAQYEMCNDAIVNEFQQLEWIERVDFVDSCYRSGLLYGFCLYNLAVEITKPMGMRPSMYFQHAGPRYLSDESFHCDVLKWREFYLSKATTHLKTKKTDFAIDLLELTRLADTSEIRLKQENNCSFFKFDASKDNIRVEIRDEKNQLLFAEFLVEANCEPALFFDFSDYTNLNIAFYGDFNWKGTVIITN